MAKNDDTIDTVSLGVNAALIPKTLDLRLAWSYSRATGKMRASNPVTPTGGTAAQNTSATAVHFPDIKDSFHQLEASLRYSIDKNWTIKLAYFFERFSQTDFRPDGPVPFPNPAQPDIFLGNDLKDYTAQIVSVILGYRF